jgi:hypothetical protein
MQIKKILMALAILFVSAGMISSSFASAPGNQVPSDLEGSGGLIKLANWIYNNYNYNSTNDGGIVTGGPWYGNESYAAGLIAGILEYNRYEYVSVVQHLPESGYPYDYVVYVHVNENGGHEYGISVSQTFVNPHAWPPFNAADAVFEVY